MLSGVGMAAFTPLPLEVLAVTGPGVMIAVRCLCAEAAFWSLDAWVHLLRASTIPLGLAMEATGLAERVI